MQAISFATEIDVASRALDEMGHGVLIRHFRTLLEHGKTEQATRFLDEAARRMPLTPVVKLADRFAQFRASNDAEELFELRTWRDGTTRELERPDAVMESVQGKSLGELFRTLAEVSTVKSGSAPDELIQTTEFQRALYVENSEKDDTHKTAADLSEPLDWGESGLPTNWVVAILLMLMLTTLFFCLVPK